MPQSPNLYAPPKAPVEDVVPDTSGAHEIRQEHIKTEAAIRSIGTLYYLGGTLLCIIAVAALLGNRTSLSENLPGGVAGVIFLACGVLTLFVARGLRKLTPWARIAALVFATLGILTAFTARAGAPVGLGINGYILYLLLSKKGKRIFESDYADIVAATPDVKSKTSVVVWVALILLVLVVLSLVVVGFSARHR